MSSSDAPGPPPGPGGSNLPVPISRAEAERDGFFARLARALFGWKNGPTRADIEVVLEAAGPGEAGVSPEERTMIKNILALRGRRIEDVMVPRGDIIAVQQDISLGQLVKVFEKAGHSRLVAYDDTLDDPTGMVHIRDLIAFMTAKAAVDPAKPTRRKKARIADLDLGAIDLSLPLSAAKIVREMLFVPPSMPAMDLLAKMQATRIHLSLVVDEYGGADGVVSIEDIVEQIVGDIADEHDEDTAPGVIRQPDGSYVADARASIEDVAAFIGPEFDVAEEAQEVDTLAGYVAARIGRLPVRGELVPGPGPYEIEILDADPRRVKRVKIYRSTDRPDGRKGGEQRRALPGSAASPGGQTTAPAPPPLPVTRDASVKLSPDAAPPKPSRRP